MGEIERSLIVTTIGISFLSGILGCAKAMRFVSIAPCPKLKIPGVRPLR
jgi:hypothetical protein